VVRREASTPPAARWTLPRLRHSRITGHHRKKETVLKSHQALARSTTRLIDKLPAVGNTPNKPRASAAPPANNFLAVFVMSRSELTNARKQHTPITQTTICSKFIDRSLLRSCTPQFIDGRTRALSGSRPWDYPHRRILPRVRSNAWFRAGVYSESAGHLFPAYFYMGKRAARNRGSLAARGRTLARRVPR
jgi:hypothetical protein